MAFACTEGRWNGSQACFSKWKPTPGASGTGAGAKPAPDHHDCDGEQSCADLDFGTFLPFFSNACVKLRRRLQPQPRLCQRDPAVSLAVWLSQTLPFNSPTLLWCTFSLRRIDLLSSFSTRCCAALISAFGTRTARPGSNANTLQRSVWWERRNGWLRLWRCRRSLWARSCR